MRSHSTFTTFLKGALGLSLVVVGWSVSGCGDRPVDLTTHTFSSQFATRDERMDFLAKYLRNQGGLKDAVYEIHYQDNGSGRGVPGPSDYGMTMVLRVEPDSLNAWITDVQPLDVPISHDRWRGLTPDSTWNTTSAPEVYASSGQLKLVHRKEGIVFAYYSTMPVNMEDQQLKP